MLLVDYPTSFGGNVLQRPAQVDGIQAKMGEWVCLVFHPTSSPSAPDLQAGYSAPHPPPVTSGESGDPRPIQFLSTALRTHLVATSVDTRHDDDATEAIRKP
jgi:hypothetical protein